MVTFSPIFAEVTAYEVVKKAENAQRGQTVEAQIAIQVQRPRFVTNIRLTSYDDRLGDRSFIRILEPKKDAGVTYLRIKKDLWNYIPKIGKEIKIEGSLLGDSWMGSDFSNDDLIKASSYEKDYSHSFTNSSDNSVYAVELRPKPGSPVEWSRVLYVIQKSDFLPKKQDFFDHKGRLKKRIEFSRYEVLGSKKIPRQMTVFTIDDNKVRSQTTLFFESAVFDTSLANSIFTKANLRR